MTRGMIHHLRNENVQAVNDFERAAKTDRFALQAYSCIAKCNNALRDYNAAELKQQIKVLNLTEVF